MPPAAGATSQSRACRRAHPYSSAKGVLRTSHDPTRAGAPAIGVAQDWGSSQAPRARGSPSMIRKLQIPPDLVVAQEASDVESSLRVDFLLLHNLRTRFVA